MKKANAGAGPVDADGRHQRHARASAPRCWVSPWGSRASSGPGATRHCCERVKALAPDRIEVLALGDGSTGDWAKSKTGGEGVDFVISALGPGAPAARWWTRCARCAAAAGS